MPGPTIGAHFGADVSLFDQTSFKLLQSTGGDTSQSDAFAEAAPHYRRNAGGGEVALDVTLPFLIADIGFAFDHLTYRITDPDLIGRDFGLIGTNWFGGNLALHAGKYDGPVGFGGGGSIGYGSEVYPLRTELDFGGGDTWIIENGDDRAAGLWQVKLGGLFYAELTDILDLRLGAGWQALLQGARGGIEITGSDDGRISNGRGNSLYLSTGLTVHTPR